MLPSVAILAQVAPTSKDWERHLLFKPALPIPVAHCGCRVAGAFGVQHFSFLCTVVSFSCHFPLRCKIGRGPRKTPPWETGCLSTGAAGPHTFAAEVARGVKRALWPWAAGFVAWLFPAKSAAGGAPTRPSGLPRCRVLCGQLYSAQPFV